MVGQLVCAFAALVSACFGADGGTATENTQPLWSLRPVARPELPAVQLREWPRNPVDHFILNKLESRGLQPAPPADRRTFIRRATFDLLGLPPTAEEIHAFLNDRSPDAYERLIDRLLASPHYGERWGRHWLDVVRYTESDGFEHDKPRDHAWTYRDYVIRSFNEDKPYDQFITEQLAGDAIEPVTRDGIIATGFLVAGPWDEIQFVAQSATERKRAHEEQLEELIGTVSQTFLGMTVHCARCHDHKFDPIPQEDYYRFKAVFDGVDHRTGDAKIDGQQGGNRPALSPAQMAEHETVVAPLRERIAGLRKQLEQLARQVPGDATVKTSSKENPFQMAEGRFGRAIDPRGIPVSTPTKPEYDQPPITVECWTRLRGKGGFNILVAANPKESSEHWEIYSFAGTGEFSALLPGYEPGEIKSGVEITDGNWHYVAMTFDGARVALFVDGRLVREIEVKRRGSETKRGEVFFGSYPPQKIGCDGIIDEVRISNTVRAIDRVPDAPFMSDEHTVGLWHFDELVNDRFEDASRSADESLRERVRREQDAVTKQIAEIERELASLAVPLTYIGVRREPEPTRVLVRGDIDKPAALVSAGALTALSPESPEFDLPAESSEATRRVHFARWVADAANPLTARVMVNRIWQYHFGRGLVETPSDLGMSGGPPSHPELLDWLASEFTSPTTFSASSSAWSIKRMHKLIMLSATYGQSSQFNEQASAVDADNRLLWRFTPQRLEAETVRDAMLATSGELNRQIGGPSFRPFTITVRNTFFYNLFDSGEPEFNRRTVYRMNINTGKDPLLDSLDCPSPSITAPQRASTTTTLQALSLMNDSFVLRQAERFANRVRRESSDDVSGQVFMAYQVALGRLPTAQELDAARTLVLQHGIDSLCWALLNSSEFLHSM